MVVQKSGNLPAELRCLHRPSNRPGGVEDLPLQHRRQGVPLHDEGRAKTTQNVLLVSREGCAAGMVLLRDENGAVASLREPSLVIRQKDEAVPSGLEFTRFLSAENP